MTYIRVKKINSNLYAYLIENKNTPNGPRQIVLRYLGRVYNLRQQKQPSSQEINSSNKIGLIQQLATAALKVHGFEEHKKNLLYEKIMFKPQKFTITKNKKNVVLRINDGHLCSFTMQRLINFKKTKDINKDAYTLAKYFLEAGLAVSQEQFVKFYQKL